MRGGPLGPRDPTAEVAEEVEDYIRRRAEELTAQGLEPTEARRRAEEAFGAVEPIRAECARIQSRRRRRETLEWVPRVAASELSRAARGVARRPAFFLLAAGTLALGVGANTALFSVVDAVLLRPLPFPDPERLVQVWESDPLRATRNPSPANYLDLRRDARSFEGLSAYDWATGNLLGTDEPERLGFARVAADFFATLGVAPALGPGFGPETVADGERRVVLSDGLWRRRFGGDPDVVGRTVRLDETPYLVVGVMPPGFTFPGDVSMWVAAAGDVPAPASLPDPTSVRDAWFHRVVGRLAPGTTLEGARTEMRALAARLAADYPEVNAGLDIRLVPLHDQLAGPVRSTLLVLLGATGFVLLVACANVANLLLVRASETRSELLVRRALGAGTGRIAVQLVADGLLLAAGAAAAGAALGLGLVALAEPWLGEAVPPGVVLAPDARVLGYSLALSVTTALLFGVVPALLASRADEGGSIVRASRGRAGETGPRRAREALIALEACLAVVLVLGAGLMVRSLAALGDVDLGFEPEGLLVASVGLPEARSLSASERLAFYGDVASRVEALPGVSAVGWAQIDPLATGPGASLRSPDLDPSPTAAGDLLNVRWHVVSHDYFAALDVPVVSGRGFLPTDDASAEPVALVNETLAGMAFGGRDPIGRLVNTGLDGRDEGGGWRWVRVVGVVADTRNRGPAEPAAPAMFRPMAQGGPGFSGDALVLAVRAPGGIEGLLAGIRAEVWAVHSEAPVYGVRSGAALAARYGGSRRLVLALLTTFAILAVVLGWVGIWGVTAFSVSRRAPELGVRMALGARSGVIVAQVMKATLLWTGAGLLGGVTLATLATRALESQLYGVTRLDPATFIAVPTAVLLAAVVATWLPARRAGRVDPVRAMRAE